MAVTDLVALAIGWMLVALGVASSGAWVLRRRSADRLLLLFGIWCVLYGLRTDRGTMRVANAGHPAAMIARGNGTIEEVDHHGLMLGFMADAVYTSAATHLDDGDVVFLYTDGVTEARNRAGEFFDRGNVRRWLDSKYTNATGFSEQALRDLASWRGDTAFEDDVTFVVARFARR